MVVSPKETIGRGASLRLLFFFNDNQNKEDGHTMIYERDNKTRIYFRPIFISNNNRLGWMAFDQSIFQVLLSQRTF